MPIRNPIALKEGLAPRTRVLGLDVGTKTIGMALSDTLWMVATPLSTIRRTRFRDDARALLAVIDKHQVGAIVIGLPLDLDGGEGRRTQSVRQFARNLLACRDLPVTFWDERFSTSAVERGMIEGDLSRRRRAELIDRAAAAYILQGLLDRLRSEPSTPPGGNQDD
ncbi:MAG TPA: Holliday junction resolvase RuvX [Stellaceae bacterium]|nr:Holliday junction resolvase RuvX [Stellaceae bacterium]